MTFADVSEANVSALVRVNSPARAAEANVSAVVRVDSPARIAEANISALVYANPCATQRCDLWKITRKDGRVFAFTSLDRDITFGPTTYRHCASFQDSATSWETDIGSVGSVEITGILSDDAITEGDLYGGLFDDAYLECWVVTWGAARDLSTPFRTAAGWLGKVTRGQASFTADVLGPGSRLQQAALVKFFTPGCRWAFGDSNCGVNAQSFRQFGLNVISAVGRYAVEFTPEPIPSPAAIWSGGILTWTYGRNAGVECQIDTMDWEGGALSLWDLAPYPPEIGDSFDVTPGCTYDKPGCIIYNNLINYGGFPDVPGPDSLQQNADSLFTGANG